MRSNPRACRKPREILADRAYAQQKKAEGPEDAGLVASEFVREEANDCLKKRRESSGPQCFRRQMDVLRSSLKLRGRTAKPLVFCLTTLQGTLADWHTARPALAEAADLRALHLLTMPREGSSAGFPPDGT